MWFSSGGRSRGPLGCPRGRALYGNRPFGSRLPLPRSSYRRAARKHGRRVLWRPYSTRGPQSLQRPDVRNRTGPCGPAVRHSAPAAWPPGRPRTVDHARCPAISRVITSVNSRRPNEDTALNNARGTSPAAPAGFSSFTAGARPARQSGPAEFTVAARPAALHTAAPAPHPPHSVPAPSGVNVLHGRVSPRQRLVIPRFTFSLHSRPGGATRECGRLS